MRLDHSLVCNYGMKFMETSALTGHNIKEVNM